MTFGRRAVQMSALREGISGAHGSPPPFAKSGESCIVQGHFRIQAPDGPSCGTEAHAQFRLLARDQIGAKAAGRFERIGAHHGNAAAGHRRADWGVPFDIAQGVVDRTRRIFLAQSAARDSRVMVAGEKGGRSIEPARYQLTVTIDKLHVLDIRGELAQAAEPLITSPRCSERYVHIQFNDVHSQGLRDLHGTIRRARIDIYHQPRDPDQGFEASPKAFTFVTADHYDADVQNPNPKGCLLQYVTYSKMKGPSQPSMRALR